MKKLYPLLAATLLLCSLAMNSSIVLAQVSGVSFSFSPAVEYTLFEDNAALESGYAFGGSLGMGLGQYLELNASYLLGESYRTDFSRLRTNNEQLRNRLDALDNQRVDMHRFGLSAKVNLSSAAVVPYLTTGAGLVRFSRSGLNNSDSIFLNAGAGIMFTVASRYTLFAQGTHTGYRYNPGAAFLSGNDLIAGQLETNNFSQQLVSNWNFMGGLKIYLGGSTSESDSREVLFLDEFNGGLNNLRWSFDAIYGQVFINNENLGFPSNLHLTGLQFGADFGPYAGVRGFYWQGVDVTDGIRFDDINAYGAEFRASFFRASVSPVLILGGGYMNVQSAYRSERLVRPKSQLFTTAGAGIDVDLTKRVSLTGDVRAMMLTQDGVDNRISPSKIELSPMFTLGVSYRIGEFLYRERSAPSGRSMPESAPRRYDDRQLDDQQRILIMRETALSTEIARSLAQGDTLTANNLQLQLDQVRETSMRLSGGMAQQTIRTPDDRVITLPVLEEGEIFIRFGPPPPPAPPAPAPAPPTVIIPQAAAPQAPSNQDSSIRDLELRIEELIRDRDRDRERARTETSQVQNEREQALERRIAELEARLERSMQGAAPRDEDRRAVAEEPTGIEVDLDSDDAGELQGVAVYLGVANPFQATLGIRGDYGSVFNDRFELIPEFVIGLGGNTRMYNINAITLTPLPAIPNVDISPFEPYAGLGLGIKAFSNPPGNTAGIQFVWSLHLGVTADMGPGKLFFEYSNQNFFNFNNFAAGYRHRF